VGEQPFTDRFTDRPYAGIVVTLPRKRLGEQPHRVGHARGSPFGVETVADDLLQESVHREGLGAGAGSWTCTTSWRIGWSRSGRPIGQDYRQRTPGHLRRAGPGDPLRGCAPSGRSRTPCPKRFRRDLAALRDHPTLTAARPARQQDALDCWGRLLTHPGREFHVVELEAANRQAGPAAVEPTGRAGAGELQVRPDLGDAGALLDATAKAAYQARLTELEAELEAEAGNDPARATRARGEREFLVAELANLARVNPSLGRRLAAAVRTGRYCSYTPTPGPRSPGSADRRVLRPQPERPCTRVARSSPAVRTPELPRRAAPSRGP
jgi:hypothetical protein